MESPEHEARFVREYVEGQAHESVLRLEKLTSERMMGTLHDVWDVRTETDRWWVVSNPMNLYSHEGFPSMDHVLSFHCGLMLRSVRASAEGDQSSRGQGQGPRRQVGRGRGGVLGPIRVDVVAVVGLTPMSKERLPYSSPGSRLDSDRSLAVASSAHRMNRKAAAWSLAWIM